LKTVRCAYFRVDGKGPVIVPVPVHAGVVGKPNPFDLHFDCYVSISTSRQNGVVKWEEHTIEVDNWPPNDRLMSPYEYVLFVSNHVRFFLTLTTFCLMESSQALCAWNTNIRKLAGGDHLRYRGDILVAKKNKHGAAVGIVKADLFYIERMVLRYAASL
jgi:hypothetical protein